MQEGRAQESPAPERSTRLPPSSGQRATVRSRAGQAYKTGHPQLSSPQATGCKRLSPLPQSPTPAPTPPPAGCFLEVESLALLESDKGCSGHPQSQQRAERGFCVVLTYWGEKSGREERGRGKEACDCDQGEGHIATSLSQSRVPEELH